MAEQLANDFETELTSAAADDDFTLLVDSTTGAPPFPGKFRIRINDELILAQVLTSVSLTALERGVEGTTPAAHAENDTVTHVLTKAGLDTYSRESGQILAALIEEDDTLTVPAGHQLLVGQGYTIEGELVLDGELHVVS
jgi:hypothetical protein